MIDEYVVVEKEKESYAKDLTAKSSGEESSEAADLNETIGLFDGILHR